MKRRIINMLILFVIGCLCCALLFDRLMMIHWVGATELEASFVIADENGRLISDAIIEVQSNGSIIAEHETREFKLKTDADGRTEFLNQECMSSGTSSGLRITNTFGAMLPSWKFRVSAVGYHTTEWIRLRNLQQQITVDHLHGKFSRAIIPVSLQKIQE